jgi:hypothetical protein
MKIKQAAKLWLDYHKSNSQKKYGHGLPGSPYEILSGIRQRKH